MQCQKEWQGACALTFHWSVLYIVYVGEIAV